MKKKAKEKLLKMTKKEKIGCFLCDKTADKIKYKEKNYEKNKIG